MAVGLMGGTFNPIHVGHLLVGEYIREEFNLEKVLYIPSGNPPHKRGSDVIEASHRKRLVELAIGDNVNFELSEIETKRDGYSYTIDTIKQVGIEYPHEELFFLIGTDTLFELETWKSFREIATSIDFIMYGRGRHPVKEVEEKLESLKMLYGFRIFRSEGPEIEISSTQIRDRINKGLSVRYMLPDGLISEIEKRSLYKESQNG